MPRASLGVSLPAVPRGPARPMRSGGGVLCIAALQLVVGLCLLGLYEGYKAYYYNVFMAQMSVAQLGNTTSTPYQERVTPYESPLDPRSPMGMVWWIAIVNNIFSICGLAGVLNAHRELVIAFFAYNATATIISFHYFVDLAVETGITYGGQPPALTGYEKAAAALLFINLLASIAATVLAIKAVEEIKLKQREAQRAEYSRLTVLSDTLPFEMDHP